MVDFFSISMYNVLLNLTLHLTIDSNLKNILCFFGSTTLHFISFYKFLYLDWVYVCVCMCVCDLQMYFVQMFRRLSAVSLRYS